MGWPKGREPQGHGVIVVVSAVTRTLGVQESCTQGEG